jgi:hypothetical protein
MSIVTMVGFTPLSVETEGMYQLYGTARERSFLANQKQDRRHSATLQPIRFRLDDTVLPC